MTFEKRVSHLIIYYIFNPATHNPYKVYQRFIEIKYIKFENKQKCYECFATLSHYWIVRRNQTIQSDSFEFEKFERTH